MESLFIFITTGKWNLFFLMTFSNLIHCCWCKRLLMMALDRFWIILLCLFYLFGQATSGGARVSSHLVLRSWTQQCSGTSGIQPWLPHAKHVFQLFKLSPWACLFSFSFFFLLEGGKSLAILGFTRATSCSTREAMHYFGSNLEPCLIRHVLQSFKLVVAFLIVDLNSLVIKKCLTCITSSLL